MKVLKTISLFDGKVLRAKFTVEKHSSGGFIATLWFQDHGPEEDREVYVYKTESAAHISMLEMVLAETLQYSNLKIKTTRGAA